MSKIYQYITKETCQEMQKAIAEAKGREVFFLGYINEEGLVSDVEVVARGSKGAVAAVMQKAKYGDVAIHNHPSGELAPSNADVSVSAVASTEGVASYIVNNQVNDIYVLVEPIKADVLDKIDLNLLSKLLDEDGAMSKIFPAYEKRDPQQKMLLEVADAFNHDKISLIEAGTGTGKTLAYLIPAIIWALKNKERVVISTHTINLQEQILLKDIPLVRRLFDQNFKSVLVKGRQNYVCLRKLNSSEDDRDLFDNEETQEFSQLCQWAFDTKTGDKSELNFYPKHTLWDKIQSTSETCIKSHCAFSKECYITRARREAASAHLLITNHALLFSDISMRAAAGMSSESTILPKYRRVIIDEAHNIENSATDHFGQYLSRTLFLRTVNFLYRRGRSREMGSLITLGTLLLRNLSKVDDQENAERLLGNLEDIVKKQLPALKYHGNDIFESVAKELLAEDHTSGTSMQYRLTPARLASPLWHSISEQLLDVMRKTRKFCDGLKNTLTDIGDIPFENEQINSALLDVNAHLSRLSSLSDVIDTLCNDVDENYVGWLVANVNQTFINFEVNRAPLDISAAMIEMVYEAFPTVIMTSATLTSRQKFDFMAKRIGINNYRQKIAGSAEEPGKARGISEMILPTPFDYANQSLLLIPMDIESSFGRATEQSELGEHTLRDAILDLVKVTNGSAFVLFTSYGLMRKMAKELEDEFDQLGLPLLLQGTESRDVILKRFRQESNAVLFGTDSFWAGVDVVGDSLQSVIITKLPFSVPSEPVVEARTELIDARGGKSFFEYSVPLAVIKFRQGFGRLIRSKKDFGMVAILDRRVKEKYYGRWFLDSLPNCDQIAGPIEQLLQDAKQFFAKFKGE